MPSAAIFSGRFPTSCTPSNWMSPLVPTIWQIARTVVVLPAPLAPEDHHLAVVALESAELARPVRRGRRASRRCRRCAPR